jgi:hypothetical protein
MPRSRKTYSAMATTAGLFFVMLYPDRYIYGFDLGNPQFEASIFTLCMVLWMIARGGRRQSDAYFAFRSIVWDIDARTFRHNMVTCVIEFVVFAAALELVKLLIPGRDPTMFKFLLDAGAMIGVCMALYAAVVFLLRSERGRDFIIKLQ